MKKKQDQNKPEVKKGTTLKLTKLDKNTLTKIHGGAVDPCTQSCKIHTE